jgi:hypothetical protein
MAIDIGDAVLTFLGDTTQLDQVYDRVGTEAPAKMAPAAAAIQETSAAVGDMTERMAVGANGAVELGEVTNLAGETVKESMYEARGELGLLGEAFGIHLPRHVRSFVAELPGVGQALSAAFAATAVLFLIDALLKGIEKITEWAHSAEQVQQAMEAWDKAQQKVFSGLEDGVLRAQSRLDDLSGNHMEALRLKLQLIDNQTLAKLDAELEKLGVEADKVFEKLDRNWFSKMFLGLEGSEDAKQKLKEVQKSIDDAFKTRTPEAYADALKVLQSAFDESTKKLQGFDDQLTKHEKAVEQAKNGIGPSGDIVPAPDSKQIAAWEQLGKTIRGYISDVTEAKKQADLQKADASSQEAAKVATEQAAAAKRDLDDQIAKIEEWKAKQHEAYAQGNTDVASWRLAQVQATQASTIAHEQYLQRLVVIYRQAGETQKAQATQQQLATLQLNDTNKATEALAAAEEKHRESLQKTFQAYQKLQNAQIEKDWAAQQKAVEELTKAQQELLKAQTKLAEEDVTRNYRKQEEAIKQLAQFHLISEQQKERQLAALYRQEEQEALSVLQDQLNKQKAILDAAQKALTAAQGNPFFSDAQLTNLQRNLTLAQTAVVNTEAQMSKSTDDYQKKTASLTLAQKSQMQAELQLAQARHLALQAIIQLSNATGQDTTKLQQQDRALQQYIKDLRLLLTASQGELRTKPSWDSFFKDLVNGAVSAGEAVKQMGQLMADGIGQSVAAAVSGSDSFGQAMEKMLKSALAQLAGEAVVKTLEELAKAASDLATPGMEGHAGLHFAAAAKWGAIGAGAAVAGAAIPGGSKSTASSSSSSSTTGTSAPAAATTSGPNPTQVINVQHLAGGGLVTAPTLAIVGDAPGGGRQNEAVIPLNDHAALGTIASAIAAHMPAMQGGGGEISITLESDIPHLVKKINRGVNSGRIRLLASNSVRVTRRS